MSDENAPDGVADKNPHPREISTRLAFVAILTSTALMLCVCVLPVIFLEPPFRLGEVSGESPAGDIIQFHWLHLSHCLRSSSDRPSQTGPAMRSLRITRRPA